MVTVDPDSVPEVLERKVAIHTTWVTRPLLSTIKIFTPRGYLVIFRR